MRLFVIRFVKDLLGLHGNSAPDSPISVGLLTSLPPSSGVRSSVVLAINSR
jgi:hypothetical protein